MRTLQTIRSLVEAGLVQSSDAQTLDAVSRRYAVAVTATMADLMKPGDKGDPIALQFLPSDAELRSSPFEVIDPIGDEVHSPIKGVVHRYPDRLLLKLNHTCAVYCRFCFRRETVGPHSSGSLTLKELDEAFNYIAHRRDVWEIIVTGGDPFMLSPRRLRDVISRLNEIDHVKIVRFHTRIPAVAPEMVTKALVDALSNDCRLTVYVALHANHPRELTYSARTACRHLIDAGIQMLSQTVLLRGVNDSVETLEALMRAFVEMRIRPYYLHHGDQAPGTSHLRTSLEEGRSLVHELRGRVSGLCQPTYIFDIPGGYGKVPIGPNYVRREEDLTYRVNDPWGSVHSYTEG